MEGKAKAVISSAARSAAELAAPAEDVLLGRAKGFAARWRACCWSRLLIRPSMSIMAKLWIVESRVARVRRDS